MSEPASKYSKFGLDGDPFATTIADEEIASQYSIIGRDDQEYRLREFVREGIREPDIMKRRLVFGEYGTGKSHHLIELRDEVREGVEVDGETYGALAIYVGNLGLSIRRLYERIVEELIEDEPRLQEYIDSLPSVEPEDSVDEAYLYEKLQDNVASNLRKIVTKTREEFDYQSIYLFIDEAEDIAAETDEQKVQRFVRSFLHLVNELNTSGLHILLGFSQGARTAITQYEDDEDSLGNALVQRFQGDDIYLGDLTEKDVKEMLIDRMDVHRTSNRGELTPIVEDTVGVVTEITGGHPRAVLRVYSEALDYAAEVDADRIDGEAIVHALSDFTSLRRDEDLLSLTALNELKQALDDTDSDARNDFERLQGRLIGEAEAVPETAFTGGVPEQLMSPVTVTGELDAELRVLEKRDQHGRYSYVLSGEAKDFLFRGKADEGTELQKLDMQATSASKKFQQELSRGLALSLRDMNQGSMHREPVTLPVDRYEYGVYLIDMDRGHGKRDQTVAVGVYNGQEIPKELVELYVQAHRDRDVSFGVLVKENQQKSAEANKFLKDLDSNERRFFTDRVVKVNLTTEQRDNFVYGRLLAVGDSDVDSEDMVDSHALVSEIGLVGELQKIFSDKSLPYPEKVHRDVIDHLEANGNAEYAIGDIRDELDIKDYDLNADIMAGLKGQNLVAKSGRRWTYPDIENDRPPWYKVYSLVNEKNALTVDEIKQQLVSDYALGCSPGDENAMLQWYLDHLQRQNYVEPTTVTRDGETLDAFTVVSVGDQFSEARSRAENRLDAAEDLYETSDSLETGNINKYSNKIEDLSTRLDEFEEVFDPDHEDLNDVRILIDEIVELEENLDDMVEERKEVIVGDAVTVQDSIDELKRNIAEADVEGALASQLDDYGDELDDLDDELDDLIENEKHERLLSRAGQIEIRVDDIQSDIESLIGIKQKATERFKALRDTADAVEHHIEGIADENERRSELREELDNIESRFDEYRTEFNRGDYEDALDVLEAVEPDFKSLKESAKSIEREQEQYLAQLDDFEPQISSQEGEELLEETRRIVREGDFATAPPKIDELREYIRGPTRREQFVTALEGCDGVLSTVVDQTDFDDREAFEQLQDLYAESDSVVDDIHVVMADE